MDHFGSPLRRMIVLVILAGTDDRSSLWHTFSGKKLNTVIRMRTETTNQ